MVLIIVVLVNEEIHEICTWINVNNKGWLFIGYPAIKQGIPALVGDVLLANWTFCRVIELNRFLNWFEREVADF